MSGRCRPRLPDGLTPIMPIPSNHAGDGAFLIGCCDVLVARRAGSQCARCKSGDGDTARHCRRARALINAVDRCRCRTILSSCAIGQELSQTMGAPPVVLLAIFFAAAGMARRAVCRFASAAGRLARMQEIGGARIGDRTMVDALRPDWTRSARALPPAAAAAREGAKLHPTLNPRECRSRGLYQCQTARRTHRPPALRRWRGFFQHSGTLSRHRWLTASRTNGSAPP